MICLCTYRYYNKERRIPVSSKNGWQLCGNGPEAYEKYIVPAFSGAWARDIVSRARLRKGKRVLDVGCGSGIVARYAYNQLGEDSCIVGIDINKIMLKKASEIVCPKRSPVELIFAPADKIPFVKDVFDVVFCQQCMQYFTDRHQALTEIRRVLAYNGRIYFSVWRPIENFPFYRALYKALETYVNQDAATLLLSAFSLGDSRKLKHMFKETGFTHIDITLVNKNMCFSPFDDFLIGGIAASPFGNEVLALSDKKREEMFQMIRESLSYYIHKSGFAAPMECYVISAQK